MWADLMQFAVQEETDVVLMRFLSVLPEQRAIEAARIHTSRAHAQRIVDAMCRELGYYPQRPE